MQAIGPGDWVECVDNAPRPGHLYKGCLVLGGVYQVHSIIPRHLVTTGEEALMLVGHVGKNTRGNWDCYTCDRFRPIYRPKQSIINALKQPISHVTEEA